MSVLLPAHTPQLPSSCRLPYSTEVLGPSVAIRVCPLWGTLARNQKEGVHDVRCLFPSLPPGEISCVPHLKATISSLKYLL